MSTFGKTTQGSGLTALQGDTASNGDPTGNNKQGSVFTMPEAGTITKVSMDITGNPGHGPGADVRAVIYDAGGTKAKRGESATRHINRNTSLRQFEDFTLNVHLPAGDYILSYLGGETSQSLLIGYDVGGNRFYNTDAFSNGASDPFGTATNDAVTLAINATYTPDTVNVTVVAPPALATASRVAPAAVFGVVAPPARATASRPVPTTTGNQVIVVVPAIATARFPAPHPSSSRIAIGLYPNIGGDIELVEDP